MEKFTGHLKIVKNEQLLSMHCITDVSCTALPIMFFVNGDVNCSFPDSSEFYKLNTSKQCKVNHKIWPW
jgi:hypothetical protein